jgi:carboxymethylenebutenolidase
MCFDLDSQPPVQPIAASDARGEVITLTSADGTPFAAYVAHADSVRRNGAGIVILPDVRGLYSFYKDLALRFAEAGVAAVAIDYFGRTAGVGERDDSFDYMPQVMQTKQSQIRDDVAAAIARLRSEPDAPRTIFAVGFCFGGSNSYHQASNHLGLAGVIGYYGGPVKRRSPDSPAPIERIADVTCPILGFFGGADHGIPEEDVRSYDEALTKAGIEHEMIVYPGAPHSFFDRKYQEFAKESEDSWNRALAFIDAHTPQP